MPKAKPCTGWLQGWMAFLFPVLSPTAILVGALLLTQAAAAVGNIFLFTNTLNSMIFDRRVKKRQQQQQKKLLF